MEDEVRQAYEDRAGEYAERFGSTAAVHPDDLALIGRHLSIGSGPVLDVGCGPGHLTAHLGSLGVEAVGVDPVAALVARAHTADPTGCYLRGSVSALPVVDRAVAGVLAWYSLIHVPPDVFDDALAELHRVTVSGATLVVGFFDGDAVEAFDHQVIIAFRHPADAMSERLDRAGFAEVERQVRPGRHEAGHRPHAAIVAVRT